MNNPRMTPKERNLVKGAIRRVFSRSDLRRSVLLTAKVEGITSQQRPRVKTWYICRDCDSYCAGYEMQVDHIDPVIPVNVTLEGLTWDTIIDRMWCEKNNLRAICLTCHKKKSKIENAERRKNKKERKSNV